MILITGKRRAYARLIADYINRLGIICYPTSLSNAPKEICPMYRLIIVTEPDRENVTDEYLTSLRRSAFGCPIVALYQGEVDQGETRFDALYSDRTFSAKLVTRLIQLLKEKELPCIGDYRLAGINASATSGGVTYFEEAIDLSRTEAMILRFLMRSYPKPKKSETIVKYIYPPTKRPDPSTIRTHICKINKKFKDAFGNCIITSPIGTGYLINTPEIKELYHL